MSVVILNNIRVVFVQGRSHRAGAQTCLARLLRHETVRKWNPAVLCSKPGWLTQECERLGVPVILEPFPSSRSLAARLYGISAFSRRVAGRLGGCTPAIVHANDHQEGLLALAVANRLGAKTAIVLRSPGMRREDYFKYRCNEFGYVSAIGDELAARVQSWDPARRIDCVYDGVFEDEFLPPKPKPASAPNKVLVIGSPLEWKGWADLTEAIFRLEQKAALPRMQFDFTGDRPAKNDNDLKIERLKSRCNFLGRVEAFRDLVRAYDLVINPSRMETFGMAAVEVLAAGVPLLSSRTGVIEAIQTQEAMLFASGDVAMLADALETILREWTKLDFGIDAAQRMIRQKFMIDHAAHELEKAYASLTESAPDIRRSGNVT